MGLAESTRRPSGLHRFIDWFKNARDFGYLNTSWRDQGRMEDALSPKIILGNITRLNNSQRALL